MSIDNVASFDRKVIEMTGNCKKGLLRFDSRIKSSFTKVTKVKKIDCKSLKVAKPIDKAIVI